jgi:hypothetical protein
MILYIFRTSHCIFAVSGILTLYMLPYVAPIKSGLAHLQEDIVYLQYLVSSRSVCCHKVHRLRAD